MTANTSGASRDESRTRRRDRGRSVNRSRERETVATAWVDLASPSHPFLFRGLLDGMENVDPVVTARMKTETVPLAREVGFDVRTLGRDFDDPTLRKIGIPLRTLQLAARAPSCDVALCSRNAMCVLAAKVRGIPSIHFTDNDITAHIPGLRAEMLYNSFESLATHNVVPAAFEIEELTRWGTDPASIHTYDGYKEDIYVANFEPDPSFVDALPFEEFVVVRPEALTAAYVDADESLVPEVVDGAVSQGKNVVYLPRGRDDTHRVDEYPDDRVYVPEEPLHGLQLAWHADCVLTGSGTMAREAAAMDTPAVSFFPEVPLSVDQQLIEEGRITHSRDPDAILDALAALSVSDTRSDLQRSQEVRREVVSIVDRLVDRYVP